MTNRSKWTEKNQEYLKLYCGSLRAAFNRTSQFESCRAIQIIALFPYRGLKDLDQLQSTKPDASNILKGVEDALIRNDQEISYAECLKLYGPEGAMFITLVDAT